MERRKSYIALVYCNGRIYNGKAGAMYDGPPPRFMSMKGCTNVNMLRQKIHSRLKLQQNQVVSSVMYRFPMQEAKYMAYELCDNEDLECAIRAYEHHSSTVMELYVKVAANESISGVRQHASNEEANQFHINNEYDPMLCSSMASVSPQVPPPHDNGLVNKSLSFELVCSCIETMIKEQENVPISLIQKRIEILFKCQISDKEAWKAKQKVIVKVYGDWDKSYEVLPQWMDMLAYCDQAIYKLETVPYVTVNHQVDQQKHVFNRLFWTFKPCVAAFPYCKQFIQLNAAILFGKYKGVLLVATTQDGNCDLVPLAFAIVENENCDSWSWFLALLRVHVTNKQGICLMSNHNQSIKDVVAMQDLGWQPPHAYHCYCIRHIASNVSNKCRDENVKKAITYIAYETKPERALERLENLRKVNEDIYRMMITIPKEQWILAFDEGRRYGHMTTNMVECINGLLKGVRKLPITAIVQSTFSRCIKYFAERATKAHAELKQGHKYTSIFRKDIESIKTRAITYRVHSYDRSSTRFDVVEGCDPITGETYKAVRLFLNRIKCECGRFQAYKYPCAHVIAALTEVRVSLDAYVDPVYKLDTLLKCYSSEWWPIGDVSLWDNIPKFPVLVPASKRMHEQW